MISPTGRGVRGRDDWGSGAFGASRGDRTHQGADFICTPGQAVVAPCKCYIVREARPYMNKPYSGVLLVDGALSIKLFYLLPFKDLIGTGAEQGQTIGLAQDISDPDYAGMTPHIHMEIKGANGWTLDPEGLVLKPRTKEA